MPTWAGFVFLAVVLDVYSRRIVGWAMAEHLRTELVLDALNMAVGQRRPEEGIHHSDPGSQYTSLAFGKRCRKMGVRSSTGSAGECYDNAMAESFFATLECDLLDRRSFHTRVEAKRALFDFIEGGYDPHRRHSSPGYLSPNDFECAARRQPPAASAQAEVPNHPRGSPPTPGFEHNLPLPALAHHQHIGENHQLSTRAGQVQFRTCPAAWPTGKPSKRLRPDGRRRRGEGVRPFPWPFSKSNACTSTTARSRS